MKKVWTVEKITAFVKSLEDLATDTLVAHEDEMMTVVDGIFQSKSDAEGRLKQCYTYTYDNGNNVVVVGYVVRSYLIDNDDATPIITDYGTLGFEEEDVEICDVEIWGMSHWDWSVVDTERKLVVEIGDDCYDLCKKVKSDLEDRQDDANLNVWYEDIEIRNNEEYDESYKKVSLYDFWNDKSIF